MNCLSKKNGCNGNCCVIFFQSERCKERTAHMKKVVNLEVLETKETRRIAEENLRIEDMVIPLSTDEALERYFRMVPAEQQKLEIVKGILASKNPPKDRFNEVWQPHTCKHFNEETRKCKIYTQRPRMCSQYPYYGSRTKRCQNGCDCQDGRKRFTWRELFDHWKHKILDVIQERMNRGRIKTRLRAGVTCNLNRERAFLD
jgi:Fe-S-cluster containining protein